MPGDLSPPIEAERELVGDRTTAPQSKRLGLTTFGLLLAIGAIAAARNYLMAPPPVAAAPPPAPR